MDSDSTRPSVDDSERIPLPNESHLMEIPSDSSLPDDGGEDGKGIDAERASEGEGEGSVLKSVAEISDSSLADDGGGDEKGIDAVDASGEGEGSVLKSVAEEISDVVERRSPIDGGGEENAAFNAQDGGDTVEVADPLEPSLVVEEAGEKDSKEGDSAAEQSDSLLEGEKDSVSGDKLEESKAVLMEEEVPSHSLPGSEVNRVDGEKDSISEDKLEESKAVLTEEEVPSHDLPGFEVNRVDYLTQEVEPVACKGMADGESKLGQNIEKVNEMGEETTAQVAASLDDLVNDIEIPDDKEVASVAGFTEIPSQDKMLEDSVPNSASEIVEDNPLKELQIGEGAKDLYDGDAKEDVDVTQDATGHQVLKKSVEREEADAVLESQAKPEDMDVVADEVSNNNEDVDVAQDAMGHQVLNKSVEREKADAVAELESQAKPQEVDGVADEVSDKNEAPGSGPSAGEETVMDPEVGKAMDIDEPEGAEELETDVSCTAGTQKNGDEMDGVGEEGQRVDREETREVDGVADEVSNQNEAPGSGPSACEETVMDPDVGKAMDTDEPEGAEELDTDVRYTAGTEKNGDEMGGVGEAGQGVDLEETREALEELVNVDKTKITGSPEETGTGTGFAGQEKDDNLTDLGEAVETHGDSSVADIGEGAENHEEMGITEMTETREETDMSNINGTKISEVSEEIETRADADDEEKDEDLTDVAEDMGVTELTETPEETDMSNINGTKVSEVSEEIETRANDDDEEKDEDLTDVAEDMETHGDSPLADREGSGNHEEMEGTELTETHAESVMTETGDEEPEETEDGNKSAGGKRKRVKNTKTVKGTGKKKEEDVCFMCFDGGDLVLCDRRGCPKAYHPSCVGRDEDFFRSKGKWNCGWHLCSKCEKTATYLCYTCMFSLCKGCAKDAVFFCIRGNKGLCETCMETVKLIERKEQEKEPVQLDFDNKASWEYLFKDYWTDMKTQLSLSPEEIDQAKSPQKGHESPSVKQGTARETDDATDGESDSDSPPRKRKTRSRSKSVSAEKMLTPVKKSSSGKTEWASKELMDVVMHMRHGDRSILPHTEVHVLLLDYIKRYNLRDPRRKSQVICDSRLQNLFGKSQVGHIEMLKLLDTHFLKTEEQQADDTQGGSVDTEPDLVDVGENLDHTTKSGKDKKRKARKKGTRKGRQSNLDDFAAVDMFNINLIYLRRSLVEDLLEDSTGFEEKVASAFVRLRIPGNQKQDIYRLVQVVGTSKAPEPYKVGKKTTDFVLEILNLDKREVISIDIISNQDFTEDECKRLKQSIKFGLINRLTVGDIQEKAIALQEVRVKNLLEAEIQRFIHLRDRASDMGHRKELRECVEKLQLLKSPEERQRRLEEIPEIHADPKMDPDCESEDEDEKEEKEKEKHLRPRSSSFNRRGRDPISPRKTGFSSSESWSGTSNYSNTSGNRELSRSYSGRGDRHGSSEDKVSESVWTSGREREMQQSLGSSEKPRSVSLPDTSTRISRAVPPELSPRIAPETPTAPPAVGTQPTPKSSDSEKIWHYKDPSGKVQGPFSMAQLRKWNNTGYFPAKLEIWKAKESPLDSVLLTDALVGLFQKQTQPIENTQAQVGGYTGQFETNLGSTARTAPSILDIPRNSQDTWSSGGSLPSPTPNQITTPTAKRRNFESRWSPTKPSPQPAVHSMDFSLGQSGPSQSSRADIPVVVNSAGALQPGTHAVPATNISANHYGGGSTLPSPTPAGGMHSWGNLRTEKLDSHGRGRVDAHAPSASYGTTTPNVHPSQNQPGFPSSESWTVPVPSQLNSQAQAPPGNNLTWGLNTANNGQSSGQQPQAPPNQNSSWVQGTVTPNMGWSGSGQSGINVNWVAPAPPSGQGIPNPGWGGPIQAYPNAGWGATGQAQPQPQPQAPGSTGSGWMQPGQGMQYGNSTQNWGAQNQMTIPSGGSGYWGNQQNQNGDSGYGWNKQSSGSGGQRVCKFYRENGYCKKGASCNYLHN